MCNAEYLMSVSLAPLTHVAFLWLTLLCSSPIGASICWVAIDGSLAGYLALADSPRPEAAAAVQQLLSCGIVVAMLTGDNPGAAAAVAAAVGLEGEHVHASLLPQDKFDAVSLACNWHLITLESAPVPVPTAKAGPEYHLSLFYVKGCVDIDYEKHVTRYNRNTIGMLRRWPCTARGMARLCTLAMALMMHQP